jgi:hypothetical protein
VRPSVRFLPTGEESSLMIFRSFPGAIYLDIFRIGLSEIVKISRNGINNIFTEIIKTMLIDK